MNSSTDGIRESSFGSSLSVVSVAVIVVFRAMGRTRSLGTWFRSFGFEEDKSGTISFCMMVLLSSGCVCVWECNSVCAIFERRSIRES